MATPWFISAADFRVAEGHGDHTRDVEFAPRTDRFTYAKVSLNHFAHIGGDSAWVYGGLLKYRTRRADGVDVTHADIGAGRPNGVANFVYDTSVASVTFKFGIGAEVFCNANFNIEIWSIPTRPGPVIQPGFELLREGSSKACVLFDSADGRILHSHSVTALEGVALVDDAELEARTRQYAEASGRALPDLKALHVPPTAIEQDGVLKVDPKAGRLIAEPGPAQR